MPSQELELELEQEQEKQTRTARLAHALVACLCAGNRHADAVVVTQMMLPSQVFVSALLSGMVCVSRGMPRRVLWHALVESYVLLTGMPCFRSGV